MRISYRFLLSAALSRATVQMSIKRLKDIGCLLRYGSRRAGSGIVVRKDS